MESRQGGSGQGRCRPPAVPGPRVADAFGVAAARPRRAGLRPPGEDAMKTCARLLLVLGAWAITGRLTADVVPETQTVSGTVVSSGNISLVVDADDGRRMTLVIDTATTLSPG